MCGKMSQGTFNVRDVGITAIEIYFPKNFVSQSDLEKFDGCSEGKYTIGLGQEQMSFCADNEDIVSISLTVTDALLHNYNIDASSVGFLAVGTETLIDKSKSVKTELMRLFGDNTDIEGVDVKNACFGGTQAVFHAVDWVYANYVTEKRYAIAVLADIAVYESGPARPTGGVGAVALLIAPDAPITFDRGCRAVYMTSAWDFYKPLGRAPTEYPVVDGPVSLQSYMKALDECYALYKAKARKISGEAISLTTFSAVMFHSPFTRMVQKALARLAYRDYEDGVGEYSDAYFKLGVLTPSSFEDRDVMRTLLKGSESAWNMKTSPYLEFNRRIGNMYTPSLFAQLVAYLATGVADNSKILFYAYGSGSASAMFSASIRDAAGHRVGRMSEVCNYALARLDHRHKCSPEIYCEAMRLREALCTSSVPLRPKSNMSDIFTLFPGSYYLEMLDERYRRTYSCHAGLTEIHRNENGSMNGDQGTGDA